MNIWVIQNISGAVINRNHNDDLEVIFLKGIPAQNPILSLQVATCSCSSMSCSRWSSVISPALSLLAMAFSPMLSNLEPAFSSSRQPNWEGKKKKNNNKDVIRPLKYLWFHNPVVLVSINSLKSNRPLQQKQTWLHLSFPSSSSVWNLKHWTVINKVADWVFYTQPKQAETLNYVNNSLSYRSSINLKIRRSRGPRRIFSFPSWSVGWCLELPFHRHLNLYSGKGFSQFQYYIWKELFSLISSVPVMDVHIQHKELSTCTANPFSFSSKHSVSHWFSSSWIFMMSQRANILNMAITGIKAPPTSLLWGAANEEELKLLISDRAWTYYEIWIMQSCSTRV